MLLLLLLLRSWSNVVMSEAPKPTEAPKQTPQAVPAPVSSLDKKHERLLVAYSPLVGNHVTVFLYDGAIFEGTLDSFVTEGEFALILRMATMVQPGHELIDANIKAGMTFELMNIRFDDMAELKSAGKEGGIGTDAAISKKKGNFGKERELAKWVPDSEPGESLNLQSGSSGTGNWDQFAANEKLFGLKTDFNEEIYTTKLDRQSAHVKSKEAEADRIAREIMASPTSNVHLAEERGKKVMGDEESLYGAVMREKPPGFAEKATETEPLKLSPAAPEFTLNINAPEFNPSTPMTFYNKPRRNLNYGDGYGYNNYTAASYYRPPPMAPYYYASANPAPVAPVAIGENVSISVAAASVAPVASVSGSKMNPNATAFFMPTYYAASAPAYGYYAQPAYGYYAQHPAPEQNEQNPLEN
jgi:hypothetical protein